MSNLNECTTRKFSSLSPQERKAFLDSFDVVLSDCDGVLWREMQPIDGSAETAAKLKRLGKRFFFITNHNGKTRREFVDKATALSYEATEEDILSAAYLVAAYLKERNFQKKVYLFGSDGTARELDAVGIRHCGTGPEVLKDGDTDLDVLRDFERDPEVGAVVVASDPHISFPKFIKAATYARDPEVLFIGTNPDLIKPAVGTAVNPGDGCFIKAVELAANRKALILGKPEAFVARVIERSCAGGVDASRVLMVGDNQNTDVLLGKRCGYQTLLVLSGVTSLEQLQATREPTLMPDFYAERFCDIFEDLPATPRQ